jgi:hypothetical protein
MIVYTNTKSRKKKSSTKRKVDDYQAWLKSVQAISTSFATGSARKRPAAPKSVNTGVPIDRDLYALPSLSSERYDTFKKHVNQYTGDKMVGIGTLHKSNAVPIFNTQDAKDQANMRR